MKPYKVYVVGKTSNEDSESCKTKFTLIENRLRDIGAMPVTPFNIGIPFNPTNDDAIIHCRKAIMNCHAVFLIDDHIKCKRARIEVKLAQSINLDFYCDCDSSYYQIKDLTGIVITG